MQARLPIPGAPHILSVTDLTTLIRGALEADFRALWVAGEISNVRRPPSGHIYFTLRDESSQLAAVMFRQAARLLPFELTDGVEVIVRGRLGLYAQRGSLQVYVDAVEPKGRGALQLAFEQLKARLEAEGLFDDDRKRPLPFLPRRVGVVTALGGAAVHDILVTLRNRHPGVDVRIAPVRVQGEGAALEIAQAIADLNASGGVDVMIVGRGGGSMEDLWAFNEEPVARAIGTSSIPVVSAVGHEIDFTIADFVADVRAPTPTGAAQIVVPERAELRAKVEHLGPLLRTALIGRVASERVRLRELLRCLGDPRLRLRDERVHLDRLWSRATQAITERRRRASDDVRRLAIQLEHLTPARRLGQLREQIRAARDRLALVTGALLERRRASVRQRAAQLDGLSPLAVLERGYALVWRDGGGSLVRDADALSRGDRIRLRFARGTAFATVEDEQRDGQEEQRDEPGEQQ
jgi:exodeoxyribonuclease VII large subunit